MKAKYFIKIEKCKSQVIFKIFLFINYEYFPVKVEVLANRQRINLQLKFMSGYKNSRRAFEYV